MKYILANCLCIIFLSAQAQLQSFIGLNSLPPDSTSICTIPWYLGSFYTSGLTAGSYAHDFKLYDSNGDSLVLSQKLANGKPVLLIAGSLTCPVFRDKIATINQIVNTYGSQLQVFVIYTLEAHPTDTSVYFGYVNVGTQNTNAGILFSQPHTYGERKHMVDTMSFWTTVPVPVFIDGPCNAWWSTFGPAPNNAYLIDTSGKIVAKHGWFHKNPDNIFCSIDSLLGTTSGLCNNQANGNFQLQLVNQMVVGAPGTILYDYAKLINTSNASVDIGIKKLQKNLPTNWLTAFCADVCYSPNDDSINVLLAPGDTLLFSLDFITDVVPDSGSVKVGFRNTMDVNNNYQVTFRAITAPLYLEAIQMDESEWTIFPNPANQILTISCNDKLEKIWVYDILGRLQQYEAANNNSISVASYPSGEYLICAKTKTQMLRARLTIRR
ncbi:MAG: T9SS type A sorting domain-containing protein [Chitinophagaceae bacterium]|nr:T9SS type A sorting domain-containing protein [Chitinophagaceae bacterium]